ncbi:MAG TPA: tetraacyldisaccharide 4'-kinase [Acidobacteriota bacterium]|nr:tetraacyldisaccharide 4'-kinase [Acidobacteriota bacterium]
MKTLEPTTLNRTLARIYGAGVTARAAAYRMGFLRSRKLPVPVVSVGNLTVGGSGKTPLVERLCRDLLEMGYRPAVLSRGYRGEAERSNLLVSDGRQISAGAETAGDEPYLLACLLPDVPIAVGRKRFRSAALILERLPEPRRIFVLDDGFQHLALARDLDLVAIDANTSSECRLLPAGRLREHPTALRRADGVCLTRCHLRRARPEVLENQIHTIDPRLPCFRFVTRYVGWVDERGSILPLDARARIRAVALAGVAQPQQFLDDLAQLGIRIISEFLLPDHHRFTSQELDRIISHAHRLGAEAIVTTEKDRVRLERFFPLPVPLLALRIRFEPASPDVWRRWLSDHLPSNPPRQGSLERE